MGIEGRSLGDFVVVSRLGEGSHGVVYLAQQRLLHRDAVIKVLHERHRDRPDTIERFSREAALASRLDHPYAAHIYAFGTEPDGLLWLAMERVRGTPLDKWLLEHGVLSLERYVPFLDKLCEVVHTAHDQGIIHRDIKPANVMVLERAGRLLPKLLDFGVAKALADSADPVPGRLGSPAYMAPELWVDPASADARTDLYALGVLSYEVLTSKLPFRGATPREVAMAHAAGPPSLGAAFPHELDDVLQRVLARRREDRYTSALEFANAFRGAARIAGSVAQATTHRASSAPMQPAFAPGALIAGRYHLESRLGAGGGGAVWRCTDNKLAASVALKIIGDDGELERWRREVAMARRIADRNVCRVHDLGETEHVRFVTMELIEGDGLRKLIGPELAFERARDLFTQIVSGVAAIHAAGVVHRDLKPDNVVVGADGRAVIVDFGLAREPRALDPVMTTPEREARANPTNTITHAGAIVGTPRYMSPEQAAGDAVDARTDVWALGLIGHELLTGALPGPDSDGRLCIVNGAALAKWPTIVPVLRRCLAITPADRYPDAHALKNAIAHARRRQLRPAFVVAGALVLAGIAGATAWRAPSRATGAVTVTAVPTVATPYSVAIAPDATAYAYTTADARLFVEMNGSHEWKLPPIASRRIVTAWLAGWFADRSVALVTIAEPGTWHLVRVWGDGRSAVLYSGANRFTASVAGELALIGVHENAIYLLDPKHPDDLQQLATMGTGEIVMSIAMAPDAKRFAVARLPPGEEDATIQVMTLRGEAITQVWRGQVQNDVDQVLSWVDGDRVAFVHRGEGRARLYVHDLRTKQTEMRHTWPAGQYVGIGSAGNGQLLVVGGQTTIGIAVGSIGRELRVISDRGQRPAGWTSDGRVVFALDRKVVRATPAGAVEPWPALDDGETPDTLVDDDLIVHFTDSANHETVIARVTPAGARRELKRLPEVDARFLVRCAADRAAPCFIEHADRAQMTWSEFDPNTGAVGRVLHKRLRRQRFMQTAALSPDGKTLAIVEGTSELSLVDGRTGSAQLIDIGDGAELQTVGFAADGGLWASALGYRGDWFATLALLMRDGKLAQPVDVWHGPSRFYWRPTPSPDGKYVALQVLDFSLTLSRVTGL